MFKVPAGVIKEGDTLREFGLDGRTVKALWDVIYVYPEHDAKVEFEVRHRLTGKRTLVNFPVAFPVDAEVK